MLPLGNGGFSLESISAPATPIAITTTIDTPGDTVTSTTTGTIAPYLNMRTNPFYSIFRYMYALWRSANGSGKYGSDNTSLPSSTSSTLPSARSTMTFLKKPVDNYEHTIISDEFSKSSGYDDGSTAETYYSRDGCLDGGGAISI
mmetsp:Transcript_27022/g.57901  ORF Transcript_27022/g.57901 Transcript_27022/m.57901 type:complete len:145 (-) Transcript_27022:726-1160(-)